MQQGPLTLRTCPLPTPTPPHPRLPSHRARQQFLPSRAPVELLAPCASAGTHAVFSESRCLCWSASDPEPELIDGSSGAQAGGGDAPSSRFCSQSALRDFAVLCDAARRARLAPHSLPRSATALPHDSGGTSPRDDKGRRGGVAEGSFYRHIKAGWREPEYAHARELLLSRTLFRQWAQCKLEARSCEV